MVYNGLYFRKINSKIVKKSNFWLIIHWWIISLWYFRTKNQRRIFSNINIKKYHFPKKCNLTPIYWRIICSFKLLWKEVSRKCLYGIKIATKSFREAGISWKRQSITRIVNEKIYFRYEKINCLSINKSRPKNLGFSNKYYQVTRNSSDALDRLGIK